MSLRLVLRSGDSVRPFTLATEPRRVLRKTLEKDGYITYNIYHFLYGIIH